MFLIKQHQLIPSAKKKNKQPPKKKNQTPYPKKSHKKTPKTKTEKKQQIELKTI